MWERGRVDFSQKAETFNYRIENQSAGQEQNYQVELIVDGLARRHHGKDEVLPDTLLHIGGVHAIVNNEHRGEIPLIQKADVGFTGPFIAFRPGNCLKGNLSWRPEANLATGLSIRRGPNVSLEKGEVETVSSGVVVVIVHKGCDIDLNLDPLDKDIPIVIVSRDRGE